MAKLADAQVSEACGGDTVVVQVHSSAYSKSEEVCIDFLAFALWALKALPFAGALAPRALRQRSPYRIDGRLPNSLVTVFGAKLLHLRVDGKSISRRKTTPPDLIYVVAADQN